MHVCSWTTVEVVSTVVAEGQPAFLTEIRIQLMKSLLVILFPTVLRSRTLLGNVVSSAIGLPTARDKDLPVLSEEAKSVGSPKAVCFPEALATSPFWLGTRFSQAIWICIRVSKG